MCHVQHVEDGPRRGKSLSKDRDAVRFQWFHSPPNEEENKKLCVLRMTRMVFGASPSPFLLAANIRNHLKQYESKHPKVVEAISTSLYVDDFIASSRDVSEAHFVTTTAKNIMSTAHMDLCKWMTNPQELREKWEESLMDCKKEPETHGSVLKILGLVWRPAFDEFVFDFKSLRGILQSAARIFDPVRFPTPFTVRIKCIFQEIWERGLSCDEELPPDLAQKWQQWCSELLNYISCVSHSGTEQM